MKHHTLFFQILGKRSAKVSSAACMIGALRVNLFPRTACQVRLSFCVDLN